VSPLPSRSPHALRVVCVARTTLLGVAQPCASPRRQLAGRHHHTPLPRHRRRDRSCHQCRRCRGGVSLPTIAFLLPPQRLYTFSCANIVPLLVCLASSAQPYAQLCTYCRVANSLIRRDLSVLHSPLQRSPSLPMRRRTVSPLISFVPHLFCMHDPSVRTSVGTSRVHTWPIDPVFSPDRLHFFRTAASRLACYSLTTDCPPRSLQRELQRHLQ
jgi:hypothetical protein